MPYLKIRTNQAVDSDNASALLKQASKSVAEALGKPESYVMVDLDAGIPLLFAGTADPAAFVELKSIGLPGGRTAELSSVVCKLLQERLRIDPARIYVEFADAKGSFWGWNGRTF